MCCPRLCDELHLGRLGYYSCCTTIPPFISAAHKLCTGVVTQVLWQLKKHKLSSRPQGPLREKGIMQGAIDLEMRTSPGKSGQVWRPSRAAHRPSDGYGRTTNGQETGTGSPSTVRLVMSAKSQRVRTGTGTAVVRGTVVDGRPPVPHSAMNVWWKCRAERARRR